MCGLFGMDIAFVLDVKLYHITYTCIVDLSGQRKQFGFLSIMLVIFIFHKAYK